MGIFTLLALTAALTAVLAVADPAAQLLRDCAIASALAGAIGGTSVFGGAIGKSVHHTHIVIRIIRLADARTCGALHIALLDPPPLATALYWLKGLLERRLKQCLIP